MSQFGILHETLVSRNDNHYLSLLACQWAILTGDHSDIIVSFLTFVIYTDRISVVIRQFFFSSKTIQKI